jgi:hypothetical protein
MEGTTVNWRKSSYSTNGGENCVETASDSGAILVRDTTDRDGGTLVVPAAAWERFVGSVGRG